MRVVGSYEYPDFPHSEEPELEDFRFRTRGPGTLPDDETALQGRRVNREVFSDSEESVILDMKYQLELIRSELDTEEFRHAAWAIVAADQANVAEFIDRAPTDDVKIAVLPILTGPPAGYAFILEDFVLD